MVTNLVYINPADKVKVVVDTMGTGHPINGDVLVIQSAAISPGTQAFSAPGSPYDAAGASRQLGPFFPLQRVIVIPIGSQYRDIRYGTLYMKIADNGVAADWKLLTETAPNS